VLAEKKPATPAAQQPAKIPSWTWWIIAVFTALVIAMIAFAMVKPSYTRPGGGKLFKVEPIAKGESDKQSKVESFLDKPKNAFAKIWESITIAVRRWRYLRKRGGSVPEDSKPKDSKSEDNPDK
jgi:flagellar biosynthesis/type III secretory pathway M-ring protein FliF/YscJ